MFTLMFGSYTFPNKTFVVKDFTIENNVKENDIPRRHGSIIGTPYLKARKIQLIGMIHNSTEASSLSNLMAMQSALLAGENKFYMRSDRYIDCYCRKMTPKPKTDDREVLEVSIDLVAQNPFFIATGASISDVANPVGSTTLSFNINGSGNVFEEPIIYFCATGGAITNNIKLYNLTNGMSISFIGVLANGLTLKVNTKEITVLNNAVDGLSYIEGDFLTIAAGSNSFKYAGATCRVTIEHRSRWY